MKKVIFFGSLVISVLILLSGAYAGDITTPEKQIGIEEKQKPAENIDDLQDIKNTESDFKVELWVDKDDATYKVGEEVIFSFKTNKDCRLTLFNVGTSGKVYIFFPNKYQKDNKVKAGEEYRFPPEEAKYLFRLKGPAGVELVKAIATIDDVTLLSQADVKPEGDIQKVEKPQSELTKDIEVALRPVDTKKWAEAEKLLTVQE